MAAVASAAQPATQATRIYDEARNLSRRSVQEIVALAGGNGTDVWLLVGDHSQVLPETWFIDAYLEADVSGPRLRRGRVASLESRIVNGVAIGWRARSPEAKYAQVAIAPNRWPTSLNDLSIDRPFVVEGDFSDQELIALVSFVRGTPQVESSHGKDSHGRTWSQFPDRLDGRMPITAIRREGATVIVILQSSTRSGQTAELSRANGAWTLLRVTIWVA